MTKHCQDLLSNHFTLSDRCVLELESNITWCAWGTRGRWCRFCGNSKAICILFCVQLVLLLVLWPALFAKTNKTRNLWNKDLEIFVNFLFVKTGLAIFLLVRWVLRLLLSLELSDRVKLIFPEWFCFLVHEIWRSNLRLSLRQKNQNGLVLSVSVNL